MGGQLVIPFLFDPLGVDAEVAVFCGKGGVSNDSLVKRDNGGQALHRVLGQGAGGATQRGLAVWAPDDELGQHGIELAANDGALDDAGINAHARTRWLGVLHDGARGRHEVRRGILAVDAELEGVATRGGVFLERELVALSDTELLAHEIEARSFLGNWVLHLQAGIDL